MTSRCARSLALMVFCLSSASAFAQGISSVKDAYELLKTGKISPTKMAALQTFIESKYKDQDISKGTHKHLQQPIDGGGGYVVWALKALAEASPAIYAEKGRRWPMVRLGDSDLWAAAEKFPNFSAAHYRFDIGGNRMGGNERVGFETYEPTLPESQEQSGVPKGQVIDMGTHVSTKHFPGAERQWWVYVPAQYEAVKDQPVKLMVFNDGGGFVKGNGNACIVMDNLIHQKKIPVMIGVFVNPGKFPPKGNAKDGQSNRGNEYDTCSPRFATFLDEEILPAVREKYNISKEPWDHGILGSSSGGSCAFTAAWHRNDLFRRVVTFVGSFCDFRPATDYPVYGETFTLEKDRFGEWKTAHDYPELIRKTNPKREIKIFLQEGENDLDNQLGNWPLQNQRMDAALEYAGYEHKLVMGKGIHSSRHGMSILPEILVWIWNDEDKGSPKRK
jgi:enterochelin esterase family protein